jgi:hypothetical protein
MDTRLLKFECLLQNYLIYLLCYTFLFSVIKKKSILNLVVGRKILLHIMSD